MRAMRWNGVSEDRITGNTSFREKFDAFAETIPHCLGNPLYHWTHLELKRYFDWHGVFGPETADEVWELTNKQLQASSNSARGLLVQMNVEFVGTTDDPCDDLAAHAAAQSDASFKVRIAPSFRPDKALFPASPGFADYCGDLSDVSELPSHALKIWSRRSSTDWTFSFYSAARLRTTASRKFRPSSLLALTNSTSCWPARLTATISQSKMKPTFLQHSLSNSALPTPSVALSCNTTLEP